MTISNSSTVRSNKSRTAESLKGITMAATPVIEATPLPVETKDSKALETSQADSTVLEATPLPIQAKDSKALETSKRANKGEAEHQTVKVPNALYKELRALATECDINYSSVSELLEMPAIQSAVALAVRQATATRRAEVKARRELEGNKDQLKARAKALLAKGKDMSQAERLEYADLMISLAT